MDATDLITKHEGLKLRAYRDTLGHLTIGYGTNLEVLVVTEPMARELLNLRVNDNHGKLNYIPAFRSLDGPRQAVIEDMAYQLGVGGVLGFHRMWAALQARDYSTAADAMLDSLWARQTPARAAENASIMRHGVLPS